MSTIDVSPQQATSQFQTEREQEVRQKTTINQRYHLKRFVEWSDETGVESMSDLNGFVANQYKTWRRNNSDISDTTLYNDLCTIRTFLRWCEQREIVEQGLADRLDVPTPGDNARDETIDVDRVQHIIDHNKKVNGSEQNTVLFYLLWHTGIRIGSANALDVDDWDRNDRRLRLRNRTDTDTPLKNADNAERKIGIKSDELTAMLSDYIDYNHSGVEDQYGRKPLFPSRQGRPTTQTLRLNIQQLTHPCQYTGECPHGETINECEAARNMQHAYQCPSAVSPHPIRRTAITEHLNAEVPKDVVSERANVSREVLDKHYNVQTEDEKVRLREKYLDSLDH